MTKTLAGFGAIVLFIIVTQIILTCSPAASQGMVIDHNCTDLSQIPDNWLDQAKTNLHIAYQHTSHGSQLITGMNALESFPSFGSKYAWVDNSGTTPGALNLDDYGIPGAAPDLSQGDYIDENEVTPWVTATRNLLEDHSHINVIMWSWCSINGHDIQRYLDNMEILVAQYSNVSFVFMTGHAQGQGEGGFIHTANEQIRQHCENNNRILFDFADIENYDPDGNYYYDRPMWDDLDYNPYHANNWGQEWCTSESNIGSELEQLTTGNGVAGYGGCNGCAHSNSPQQANLNCVLKGRACWWMMARLAGWDPGGVNPPPQASFSSSRTRGPAPLTVNFTDRSTGSPTDWSWTFGDGGTSSETNPCHTYVDLGTYTVTLEVSNASGTDSITKTDLVSVAEIEAGPWCFLLWD